MKKLITGVAVAAAVVLLPAAPAFAIHDPNVPAGLCAASENSVGIPARDRAAVDLTGDILVHSNAVLAEHNNADANCARAR